jgi:mRNA (2'-O-methyladenosine-N6-)-methyltransferase
MRPLIRPHTDPDLGHCSYLNTCYGEVRRSQARLPLNRRVLIRARRQPSYAQSPSLGGGGPAPRSQKDCKYLHFEVALPASSGPTSALAERKTSFPSPLPPASNARPPSNPLRPHKPSLKDLATGATEKEQQYGPSWLTCDVRSFDLEVLGK